MNNRCVSRFSLPLSPAQQHGDGEREGGMEQAGGGERGRSAAAACRTHRKIKGASPFIDQVKIGLHLRLSLRCCLFVGIDKSRDPADGTLCLLSIQRRGGGRGGGEEEEEEEQHSAAKSTSSSPSEMQANLSTSFTNWIKKHCGQLQTWQTGQFGENCHLTQRKPK